MNLEEHITAVLEWDTCLPAVAQGAIGIQCREGDERIMRYLDELNHEKENTQVTYRALGLRRRQKNRFKNVVVFLTLSLSSLAWLVVN